MRPNRNRKNKNKKIQTQVTVYLEDCNNNPEKMVKRFSRMVKKSGIIDECRQRSHYVKPSVRRTEEKRNRKRLIEKINKKRDELINVKSRVPKRRR
tara:strand:- start:14 stop:301 length:288 start_codon:yes stop_codon:yes gene_type:complete